MNESSRRDLEVFDFKEEDEIVSDKHLANKTPTFSNRDSLAHDAQVNRVGVKNVASIPCIDVDIVESSDPSLKTGEDIFDSKEKNSELGATKQSSSDSHKNHRHFKMDIDYYGEPEKRNTSGGVSTSTSDRSQIGPSGSPSSNESVDVYSEADDFMNESVPTSTAADIAENGVFHVSLNGCILNGTDNSDRDETNTEVVLHPDYIIYQDNYYMGPKLTFSHCCIKINVSTACMEQEAFDLELALDDLIDIRCQLFQNSGTVIIKIRVISSNANQLDHVSDTSGIDELEIAVFESNWSMRHKQITSLNVQYLAIWNVNMDVEGNETESCGSRCYFPNFEKPFDEVIYPKGDPDAVSLSKRDFDLLQPDTFINDTIIDFYIQYLKNQILEEEKPRFHFFNSFFFRKLADMDKNPSSASDGKAAFLRVRKWTRKVNLFQKDYIFIPVNFNLHWSLIVICHPGELVNFNDEELDTSLKVPCILHMDSIKGSHSGLKNLVQSYLLEEWKERHKDALEEDLSARFTKMRFLPLMLPQQENSYDCGLFLLHYLELFLAEAPRNFNPFKLTKFSNFLNVDWFLPAEAYLKRTLIQRLIFELVESHSSHEILSSDCSDDDQYIENNENITSIELPDVNRELTTSQAEQGIEITLLSGSSSLDPHSFNNTGLVVKELWEPGATAGTILAQCRSFEQRSSLCHFNGSIFSMEADLGEQMYLATDPNFQQVARFTPQTCSLRNTPGDCGNETSNRPEISLQVAESSPSNASDDSEDIGVTENCPVRNEAVSSHEAEQGDKTCSPTENRKHFMDVPDSSGSSLPVTFVVGTSRDETPKGDGNMNADVHSPSQEIPTITSHRVSDAVDDEALCDDGQMIDGTASNICEDQAAKRRRLMPRQCRSEGIVTESNL